MSLIHLNCRGSTVLQTTGVLLLMSVMLLSSFIYLYLKAGRFKCFSWTVCLVWFYFVHVLHSRRCKVWICGFSDQVQKCEVWRGTSMRVELIGSVSLFTREHRIPSKLIYILSTCPLGLIWFSLFCSLSHVTISALFLQSQPCFFLIFCNALWLINADDVVNTFVKRFSCSPPHGWTER